MVVKTGPGEGLAKFAGPCFYRIMVSDEDELTTKASPARVLLNYNTLI